MASKKQNPFARKPGKDDPKTKQAACKGGKCKGK